MRRLKYFATKQGKDELFSATILQIRELETISDIEALETEDLKAFVMLTAVIDVELLQELLEFDGDLTTSNIEQVTQKYEANKAIQSGLSGKGKSQGGHEKGFRAEEGAFAPVGRGAGASRGARGAGRGGRGGQGGPGMMRGGKNLTCYRCSSPLHLARQCSVPRESLKCDNCGATGSHNTQSCFATPRGEPAGVARGLDAAGELEVAAVASESGSKKDTGSKETMTQIVSSMKKCKRFFRR